MGARDSGWRTLRLPPSAGARTGSPFTARSFGDLATIVEGTCARLMAGSTASAADVSSFWALRSDRSADMGLIMGILRGCRVTLGWSLPGTLAQVTIMTGLDIFLLGAAFSSKGIPGGARRVRGGFRGCLVPPTRVRACVFAGKAGSLARIRPRPREKGSASYCDSRKCRTNPCQLRQFCIRGSRLRPSISREGGEKTCRS